jgi:hypothetical protein
MAQVYSDFNQNSPPDNILNLVNERLLKPTYQQRTSKLKNYFLGYKECLDHHRLQPLRNKINCFHTSNRATRISTKFRLFPLLAEYYCRTRQRRNPKVRTIVLQFYHKANRFYNQPIVRERTSQSYIPRTGRNAEKQARELNRKEGEDIQGVTRSRPAELSKHALKALIT